MSEITDCQTIVNSASYNFLFYSVYMIMFHTYKLNNIIFDI